MQKPEITCKTSVVGDGATDHGTSYEEEGKDRRVMVASSKRLDWERVAFLWIEINAEVMQQDGRAAYRSDRVNRLTSWQTHR